jgi:LacI family transcriptional regulator
MDKVTIRDVAAAAGVSRQTVSRVLNDKPDVATETRKRVKEVIDRLGYRPSSIARSLTQGRTYTLGVVSYGVEYYGPLNTLVGIEHQANELGYTLHLSLAHSPSEAGPEILQDMLSYHVDGILWLVSEMGNRRDWNQREVCELPVPVVFLDTKPCPDLSVVNVDNRRGGYLATNHLLDQRNRCVGLITGPTAWWSARQRKAGWEDAHEAAGLVADRDLIVEGAWSASSGERGLHRLIEKRPDVDAVFACNDQMALGALKAARALGRQVPEDLGIVGFDDVPEAPFFLPPLSTVRQDLDQMGRSAVKELGRLIEASHQGRADVEPRTILLQPQLIVRDSSVAR